MGSVETSSDDKQPERMPQNPEEWAAYWFKRLVECAFRRPFSLEAIKAEQWFAFWFKQWAATVWQDVECSPEGFKKRVKQELSSWLEEVKDESITRPKVSWWRRLLHPS